MEPILGLVKTPTKPCHLPTKPTKLRWCFSFPPAGSISTFCPVMCFNFWPRPLPSLNFLEVSEIVQHWCSKFRSVSKWFQLSAPSCVSTSDPAPVSYRPLPSVPPHPFYVHDNSNIGVIILYKWQVSHLSRYIKVVRASISFLAKLLPPFYVNWNNCKMASRQI